MKNVRESQLKKCIFLDIEEFESIIQNVFGNGVTVDSTLEGLDIYDEFDNIEFGNICMSLAEYFDVKEVTSFHIDDCDYVGVWIAYKD